MSFGDEGPARCPLACGALGDYDRRRVLAIAGSLRGQAPEAELRTAHEDAGSILLLDRPAVRWSAGGAEGFAWTEGNERPGRFGSWRDAAVTLSGCGLVVEGHRRYVHTSVAGIAPVYWLEESGATYFASRVDPLVATSTSRLTADWEAWAAIFMLGYPLGELTPFREIRRLEPFAALERSHGRGRYSRGTWPWAEVEPSLTPEAATGAVLDAMRAAVYALPGRVLCPLSGGWDSRLLLCLLAENQDRRVEAFTTSVDDGRDEDERLAAAVAETLGVAQSRVAGDPRLFLDDLRERALRVDFQHVGPPWRLPLARRLAREHAVAADGLALDVLLQPGRRFISGRAATAAPGEHARPLWRALRVRRPEVALSEPLARAFKSLAKRQFLSEAAALAGSPSQALLTIYRTRTVRGISLAPVAILGTDLRVATPFTDADVATAALSAAPADKFGATFYRSLFQSVNPAVGALPSTNDPGRPRPSRTQARREATSEAAEAYDRLLRRSPLTRYLSERARGLVEGRRALEVMTTLGATRSLRALTLFGAWCERYSDRVAELDPGPDLSIASARQAQSASRA